MTEAQRDLLESLMAENGGDVQKALEAAVALLVQVEEERLAAKAKTSRGYVRGR